MDDLSRIIKQLLSQNSRKAELFNAAQAALWHIRLTDKAHLSDREEQDFDNWIKQSPLHVKEFLWVRQLDNHLSRSKLLKKDVVPFVSNVIDHPRKASRVSE